MSDAELMELIESRLPALALPQLQAQALAPTRVWRTRWSQDPYSYGAYSYCAKGNRPGSLTMSFELLRAAHNHFK
jgi:hypothetical protein